MNQEHNRLPAWMRKTAGLLSVVFALQGMSSPAHAGFMPSTFLVTESTREADLATIQTTLETQIVQHRLQELGFTAEEIQERLELASDEDLHMLAVHSDQVMAGGAVVEVLLVVVLVLLILKLASSNTLDADPLQAVA